MDPKLSPDLLAGLKRMGNPTLVNDDIFVMLLENGISTITQPESANISSWSSGSSKKDIVKEAHCALLSLMVEAARIDLSSDSLHKFLEIQVNWPQARCKKLCDAYFTIIPKLQALLINSSQHPPHIVDIQWRLDHNIKSSSKEHSSNSIVAIQLTTEGSMSESDKKDMNFVCSLSELQDLVSKLKEALRQIEHVAQIGNS